MRFLIPYVISYVLIIFIATFFLPASKRIIISLPLMLGGSIHMIARFATKTIDLIREVRANGLKMLQYSEDEGYEDEFNAASVFSKAFVIDTILMLFGFCYLIF